VEWIASLLKQIEKMRGRRQLTRGERRGAQGPAWLSEDHRRGAGVRRRRGGDDREERGEPAEK
jgi:hypothetical protein